MLWDLKIWVLMSRLFRMFRHLFEMRSDPRHLWGLSECRRRKGAGLLRCSQMKWRSVVAVVPKMLKVFLVPFLVVE